MKGAYISVECPHCGKEAARLRIGGSQPDASNPQVASAQLSPEDQAKLKPIDDLELSFHTFNCLKNQFPDVRTVGDLIQYTEFEIFRKKNIGRKTLNELKMILENMNLSLARHPSPDGADVNEVVPGQ